ncbi:MAG TPA: biotin--[acetyl-CoA-carboxylase] ligase [Gammaproteobacteria bacterium]
MNERAIRSSLAAPVIEAVTLLRVYAEIGSTNQQLLDANAPAPGELVVCLAERQTAGRGRRGRAWYARPGGSLCLSVGWSFAQKPDDLAALTLASGVVIRRALERTTGLDVELKWPNDLVLRERKLGGILVELRPDGHRSCFVVVGLGLNVALEALELVRISDWPLGAVDLSSAMDVEPPSRNILAARFIEALWQLLRRYSDRGFTSYRAEFAAADYLHGRMVSVDGAGRRLIGRAAGVDDSGVLLVECGGATERVIAGEVSVRPAS